MSILRTLENKKREFGFSNEALKLIAMISMFIDHAAIMLIKNGKLYGYDEALFQNAIALAEGKSWLILYKICRIIGRLAFPIFALLLVEGFRKTSNLFKYFIRLFLLAFISEIPYNLMMFNKLFCFDIQNVVFTYIVALFMLCIIRLTSQFHVILHIILCVIAITICYCLRTDYWLEGCLLVFVLYTFRHDINIKCLLTLFIVLLSSVEKFYGMGILSIPFIYFYDERKGILNLQKFSYIFYPLHMLVLYGIVYFSYL